MQANSPRGLMAQGPVVTHNQVDQAIFVPESGDRLPVVRSAWKLHLAAANPGGEAAPHNFFPPNLTLAIAGEVIG